MSSAVATAKRMKSAPPVYLTTRSETTSPRKAPSVAPADEPGGPGRSRSLLSASARRLARILNARGGPAARRERFPKRLAELERKFERQSLAEGGRPPPAPLGAY